MRRRKRHRLPGLTREYGAKAALSRKNWKSRPEKPLRSEAPGRRRRRTSRDGPGGKPTASETDPGSGHYRPSRPRFGLQRGG